MRCILTIINEQAGKEEKDVLKTDLQEGLDFVYEMRSAVQKEYEKSELDLSVLLNRKNDLEKSLQRLKEQEDTAGTFFIPEVCNENRKEQKLIEKEIQLVEEQRIEKQKCLEKKNQKRDEIDRLIQCLESVKETILNDEKEVEQQNSDNVQLNREEENRIEEIIKEYALSEESDMGKTSESGSENDLDPKTAESILSEKNENYIKQREANIKQNILEMQECERQRIARELHDSTVQNLAALIHKLEFAEKLMDIDVLRAKMELISLEETVRKSVDEIRNIIYNLHPMQINDLGLKATLQKFVEKLSNECKIPVQLIAEDDQCKNSLTNLALFRITQEACNNAVRYSGATQIIIELKYIENKIQLIIEDNGNGFDIDESHKKAMDEGRGFGLSVMKERVFLLSGKIEFSSVSGTGTKITVIISNEIEQEEQC